MSAPRSRSSWHDPYDLSARGHDVLDDDDSATLDVGALGEAAGAVGLGGLADEHDLHARKPGGDDGERHAAKLEAG
jgi:hypothetical protein